MKRFLKGNFFQRFVPLLLMVTGGSFFIREITQIKYKYKVVESQKAREELDKHGIKMRKPVTLEEEYEKIKQTDINNWENVRIPRPWEEPNNMNN